MKVEWNKMELVWDGMSGWIQVDSWNWMEEWVD